MRPISIHPDVDSLAQAAAEHFVSLAGHAVASRGRFSVALSGGSTPRPTYAQLATGELSAQVDWPGVHVFWGDERCVPGDHPDSNYGMVRETLLDHVPIPEQNIHPIRGELEPEQAAAEYELTLREFFPPAPENPAATFDLVLLGMGADGHTASLFPRGAVLEEQTRWVVAYYVDEARAWRVTLTPTVINAATQVTFIVSGASKAETVRRVLAGPHQPDLLPAQIIRPAMGCLLWLVDAAAAGNRVGLRENRTS
ncbi:MAG: 6-phosphogluconolactonase [Chloroflexi bacterium B3_Chlor]|nr:MAG: 6-phosphogluconolactonase [Chloroflexi bacterium B3_Chlor]